MNAPPNIRMKVKKLLRLCNSPNPHEAARAQEEAGRIMRKYSLTQADFEDDVVEIADEKRDPCRHRLAHAVGLSRRVSSLVNKRGQIAFRGKPTPTRNAKETYQGLVTSVQRHCDIGPSDPGRDVWRICYWMGFVDAVMGRLIDDEVRTWRPEKDEEPVRAVEHVKEEAVAPVSMDDSQLKDEAAPAIKDFAARFDPQDAKRAVRDLCERAYAGGKQHGQNVVIEAWTVKPPQKALEASSS